jgi:uncharacterized protein with FMN-binding domain
VSRAAPALVVTFLGLFALAAFKSSPGLPTTSATTPLPKSTVPPTSAPPPGTTGSAPPTNATSPPTTPSTNAPTTSAPANTTRTFDGDPFDNQYGPVQVRVTLQGNRITAVTPLQMPTDRRRSAEISQEAEPLLLQEALQAQSAQIDIIGGASYTSQSYAQSLQSALDKARA